MSRRTETTPINPALTHTQPPALPFPPWKHVTVNEHILIHYYHSAFTVYMRVHPWCFLLWIRTNVCQIIHHYGNRREYFHCLENLLCFVYSSLHHQPLASSDLFYCLHHFAFSRMSHNRYQIVWSLFRLASLTQNMHFRFLHCFS